MKTETTESILEHWQAWADMEWVAVEEIIKMLRDSNTDYSNWLEELENEE